MEEGVVDFGVNRPVRFLTMSEISINAFSRRSGDEDCEKSLKDGLLLFTLPLFGVEAPHVQSNAGPGGIRDQSLDYSADNVYTEANWHTPTVSSQLQDNYHTGFCITSCRQRNRLRSTLSKRLESIVKTEEFKYEAQTMRQGREGMK
ncbi:hypothetical protein EYF80_017459 [Liparis tanakae]|uniref:Uncharacterized protein n=1 Tax=Liparis tanakae TaxID=230148 RepID=A0A4Z2I2U5_9TELE|nr:hypothetical protein EYF80_017459 [Liparis tanakae]